MKYRIFLIITHFGHKLKTHLHFVTCFYHHWIFSPDANKINIHSYPPYWRLILHLQPEDAPCHGDRDPLMRPRHWWEGNIKMNLHEEGCAGINWIELAQDRDRWPAIVNTVMNFPCSINAANISWTKFHRTTNSLLWNTHTRLHKTFRMTIFPVSGFKSCRIVTQKKLAAKVVLLWFHCLSLKNIYSKWQQQP